MDLLLCRDGQLHAVHHVLNECLIDRGSSPSMVRLELYVDGHHITTVRVHLLQVLPPCCLSLALLRSFVRYKSSGVPLSPVPGMATQSHNQVHFNFYLVCKVQPILVDPLAVTPGKADFKCDWFQHVGFRRPHCTDNISLLSHLSVHMFDTGQMNSVYDSKFKVGVHACMLTAHARAREFYR